MSVSLYVQTTTATNTTKGNCVTGWHDVAADVGRGTDTQKDRCVYMQINIFYLK